MSVGTPDWEWPSFDLDGADTTRYLMLCGLLIEFVRHATRLIYRRALRIGYSFEFAGMRQLATLLVHTFVQKCGHTNLPPRQQALFKQLVMRNYYSYWRNRVTGGVDFDG